MKITKRQLRRIIKEEKGKILKEQTSGNGDAAALQIIDEIGYALEDALDQKMQVREEEVGLIKAALDRLHESLMMRIDDVFEDHLKKVKMDGRSTAY